MELLGTQTRIVQGERWHHRVIEAGSEGDPLILIHGVGGHAETYARNLRTLSQRYHVYAIDALYHGFSSKEPYDEDRRTELQADALADLIRALGHSWAHIEGESMGAGIAFELGMKYPDMAGKIILNTGTPQVRWKRTFKQSPGGGDKLQTLSQASILHPSFENHSRADGMARRGTGADDDEMVNIRLRMYSIPEIYESIKRVYHIGTEWTPKMRYDEEDLQRFKPETLVAWTEHNPGRGPDFGEYLASCLPNAYFYNVLDASHWPQWEKPRSTISCSSTSSAGVADAGRW